MKRNLYNLKIRGTGGDPEGGIGIGGIGIGNPDGEGIGFGPDDAGSSEDIMPDGIQFYNVKLDRILYYLTCSNDDSLGSVNDLNLRAYNVE